jgi:hypothetical protein
MKALLLVVLVVVAAGIGYPLVNEETTSACSALERRLIVALPADPADLSGALVLGSLQKSLSDGSFAAAMVKRHSPNLPPFVSCDFAYWRVTLDPGQAKAMISELLPSQRTNLGNLNPAGGAISIPPAVEADKAMRALTNPTAPPAAAPDQASSPPSYKPSDQHQLDRLIGNQK